MQLRFCHFLQILLSGLQTNSFLERQSASAGVQASEEAPYPAALAVNSDIVTAMAAAEATDEHELATPTLSHIPTPLPTPAVTRVPVAKFPILSGPTDDVFTLIYLEDNRLLAIDSDGSSSRVLLDVSTRVPLYVATDKVGVQQWGKRLARRKGKSRWFLAQQRITPPKKGMVHNGQKFS